MSNIDENNQQDHGFYAIIPAPIMRSRALEPSAKLLYGDISGLSRRQGYCFASNEFFSELYDVDDRTIQRWLESLKKNRFIRVHVEKKGFCTKRRIYLRFDAFETSPIGEEEKENEPSSCTRQKHSKNVCDTTKMSCSTRQKCRARHDKNAVHTNTITNTEEQQQPAAAFFSEKYISEKPQPSASSDKSIYPCLESLDVAPSFKKRTTHKYDEQKVIDAVSWAIDPSKPPKNSLEASIEFACANSIKCKPRKGDQIVHNRAYAFSYDNMICNSVRILSCNTYVEITVLGCTKDPVCLKYDQMDFTNIFRKILTQYNFPIK